MSTVNPNPSTADCNAYCSLFFKEQPVNKATISKKYFPFLPDYRFESDSDQVSFTLPGKFTHTFNQKIA